MLSNAWTSIKEWFKHSWSIFIARMEVLGGIALGVLTGIDWNAITALDFSHGFKNLNTVIVAGLFIVKGIVSEIGRRAGTVETKNSVLVPTSIVDKAQIDVK